MTDWHDHERTCAALIKGKRYPANTGGRVDVESGSVVAQCKEVKTISSPEVVKLVSEMENLGHLRLKVGVLFLRLKAGRGHPSAGMVVMTHGVFAKLLEEAYPDAGPG